MLLNLDLPTHAVFGFAIGLVFFSRPEIAILISLGTLIPDLDREYWFIPVKVHDMKKEFALLALLFVTSLTLLALFPAPVKSDFTVIRVPADYPSIQSAINAASTGSIILVSKGTYHEHLVVKKTLALIGEDREATIIDGNRTGTVMAIRAANVIIDGFTIRNGSYGIYLDQSHNSTITNNIVVSNTFCGVWLNNSNYNTLTDNILMRNGHGPPLAEGSGIRLTLSHNNMISSNIIANQIVQGLEIGHSTLNSIYKNTIMNSQDRGILLYSSDNNTIHHNNFLNNTDQAYEHESYNNVWDNGTEGNYWDDYTGLDDGSGSRVAGDGVGDTNLPHFEVDYYPLIIPSGPIPIVWDNVAYPVSLISNSTISEFRFIQTSRKITFTVRGPSDTIGYCNATIPKNLLSGNPWKIMLDGTDITSQAIITKNQTHTSIYFTYTHSNYNVQIIGTWVIPEFSSLTILSLFILTTLLVIIVYQYRKSYFHDSHLKNTRESPHSSRT